MQTTANLGLKKPEGTDVVNIQDFNDNADLLDTAVAAKETPAAAQAKASTAELNAKAYTDTKVAGLVNSSPATLDTLKELADALGSDPNYAATTATLIGTKAPLASPVLTGTPTAPTAAVDTSTTQVATTAFVLGQAGTTDPVMNGTAGVGTSKRYARADHVHPVDMSRAAQTDFAAHLADYVKQVPYAAATGSANTYAVTLNPAPTSYVDGMAVAVKIATASTGASTLNINSLGAKPILDSLGNAITSGGLKAGLIYSMRYNSTTGNFIVQGKGGGGNATASQLLSGVTATVDSGQIVGTMTNTPSGTSFGSASSDAYTNSVITAYASNTDVGAFDFPLSGYYNGTYRLHIASLLASNIKAGVNVGSSVGHVTGTFTSDANAVASQILSGLYAYVNGIKLTGTMANKPNDQPATALWTDGAGNLSLGFPVGAYITNSGFGAGIASITKNDPNFIPSNILSGKSIFGLAGTAINISTMSAGETVVKSDYTGKSIYNQTPEAQLPSMTAQLPGSLRIKFILSATQYGDTYGRVYKNGVAVGTLRYKTGTNDTTYTEDFTCVKGDVFVVYAWTTLTYSGYPGIYRGGSASITPATIDYVL